MKGSERDHHLLFPSSPSTKQNEKWGMTTVSPLPSLEAGLGKVVKFWAEDFTADPNSCIPRGWVGKEPLAVKTVTQAAGVFISYSLNPTMLCLFLLHAFIELRIICSVLKFLILVKTGIILLFRYPSAGGWAGRGHPYLPIWQHYCELYLSTGNLARLIFFLGNKTLPSIFYVQDSTATRWNIHH